MAILHIRTNSKVAVSNGNSSKLWLNIRFGAEEIGGS